jgi:hypothetical protein
MLFRFLFCSITLIASASIPQVNKNQNRGRLEIATADLVHTGRSDAQPTHWDRTVEIMRRMRAPMRPHESEVSVFERWVQEKLSSAKPAHGARFEVLLLGVTEELVAMSWPDDVRLTAVDRSNHMIAAFWPGDVPSRRRLVKADWLDMPFPHASFDLAIGDGIFHTQQYPAGYRQLAAIIAGLLKPHGSFAVRGLLQLDQKESPATIAAAFRRGEISDYHELRFRLLTSLQDDCAQGVVATKENLDQALLAQHIGLNEVYERTSYEPPPGPSRALPAQSARDSTVSFPTLQELGQILIEKFRVTSCRYGAHPLATRCPILGLEPL